MFETYRNLCWIGTALFGILAILCTLGANYYGSKVKQADKLSTTNDGVKEVATGNTYNVSGDFVQGNKTTNENNKLVAPNALIATVNQSGGQNTVNHYSNEYKELVSDKVSIVKSNIIDLVSKYPNHPTIILQVEHGNSNGIKVARKLGYLFEEYDLGRFAEGNTIIGQFPSEPISILTNSINKPFVVDLENALKPYINAQYNIIVDDKFSVDFIKFHLFGQPNFDLDGQVRIQ